MVNSHTVQVLQPLCACNSRSGDKHCKRMWKSRIDSVTSATVPLHQVWALWKECSGAAGLDMRGAVVVDRCMTANRVSTHSGTDRSPQLKKWNTSEWKWPVTTFWNKTTGVMVEQTLPRQHLWPPLGTISWELCSNFSLETQECGWKMTMQWDSCALCAGICGRLNAK